MILAGVVFATLFAQVLLYPGLSGLVAALGGTGEIDAGMWFLAAEFAAFICAAPLWGLVSDAAGRRVRYIALAALAAAIGYASIGIVGLRGDPHFGLVLGLRVLQGACTIGAFSLAMTMLMDLSGGHGRNMGAAGIAIGAGTGIGSPIGGVLAEVGPLVPLGAAAILFGVVVPLVFAIRDRAPSPDRRRWRRIEDLLDRPALAVPYAFGFIDRMTAGTFALVGVFYFGERFDLEPAGVGLMLMLFFAPFALLQYPFGIVSDRIGRFVPVIGGSLCYGAGVVSVGYAPGLLAAGLAMVLVGVFGAFVSPATMALVTDLSPARLRATAMGGFNVAGSLGFLAGIVVGGSLAGPLGYPRTFAVVGSAEILIALIALPFFRRIVSTGRGVPG